jgi:hypothetical protein
MAPLFILETMRRSAAMLEALTRRRIIVGRFLRLIVGSNGSTLDWVGATPPGLSTGNMLYRMVVCLPLMPSCGPAKMRLIARQCNRAARSARWMARSQVVSCSPRLMRSTTTGVEGNAASKLILGEMHRVAVELGGARTKGSRGCDAAGERRR